VRTEAEAQRVLRRVAGARLAGRVVTGADGLRRVRVGTYPTERDAQDDLPAVRRAHGGRPFVVREP